MASTSARIVLTSSKYLSTSVSPWRTGVPLKIDDEYLADVAEQATVVGKLTPIEYGRLRGIKPQLVYYYIRNGKIELEWCICGRRVVDVEASDKALQTQTRKRREVLDTRSDAERHGLEMQDVPSDHSVEGPGD
jgi:hypothetical protein